jgi:hypothetical protein
MQRAPNREEKRYVLAFSGSTTRAEVVAAGVATAGTAAGCSPACGIAAAGDARPTACPEARMVAAKSDVAGMERARWMLTMRAYLSS